MFMLGNRVEMWSPNQGSYYPPVGLSARTDRGVDWNDHLCLHRPPPSGNDLWCSFGPHYILIFYLPICPVRGQGIFTSSPGMVLEATDADWSRKFSGPERVECSDTLGRLSLPLTLTLAPCVHSAGPAGLAQKCQSHIFPCCVFWTKSKKLLDMERLSLTFSASS